MTFRIGGLFEGYGGLTMGVQMALGGGELAWYSEIELAACKLLAERHQGVPNLGDITLVNWQSVRRVHVLCGGFPCQDLSTAGRQEGLTAESRSGLWWRFAEAIKHLRPELVVIENVRGLLTVRGAEPTEELLAAWAELDRCDRILRLIESKHRRAVQEGEAFYVKQHATDRIRFMAKRKRAVVAVRRADARIVRAIGAVLGSLADLGYDAVWHGMRAAAVGAPHGRFRIFIVAYPSGQPWRLEHGDGAGVGLIDDGSALLPTPTAAPESMGQGAARTARAERSREVHGRPFGKSLSAALDDLALLPTPTAALGRGTGAPSSATAEARYDQGKRCLDDALALLPTPSVADGTGGHKHRSGDRSGELLLPGLVLQLLPTPTATPYGSNQSTSDGAAVRPSLDGIVEWGKYELAIRRWGAVLGRPAPDPTEPNRSGGRRLAPVFGEWMMGLPAGHVTDPVIGLTRNEQLKLIGNGVVPQQAVAAVRVCLARAAALEGAA